MILMEKTVSNHFNQIVAITNVRQHFGYEVGQNKRITLNIHV